MVGAPLEARTGLCAEIRVTRSELRGALVFVTRFSKLGGSRLKRRSYGASERSDQFFQRVQRLQRLLRRQVVRVQFLEGMFYGAGLGEQVGLGRGR